MAAGSFNIQKASGGVLNVQPADGTTTTNLVLPAINGTVVAADNNGNVGIGTVPTRKFEVYGSVPSIKISDSNAKSGVQGSIGKLEFAQHYGISTSSSIEGYQDGTATDYQKGGLKFLTNNGTTLNEAARIDIYGNVLVTNSTGGLGYGQGAGGTVTQLTSKSTAVTLNKPCGTIVMNNAPLAAGASVRFTLNNPIISVTDIISLTISGGFTGGGNYNCWVDGYTTGQCGIVIKNIGAGSLSEALVLNFTLIKGANA